MVRMKQENKRKEMNGLLLFIPFKLILENEIKKPTGEIHMILVTPHHH